MFVYIWFLIGILLYPISYSSLFGYFQAEYPNLKDEWYYFDLTFSLLVSLPVLFFPPAILSIAIVLLDNPFKHGLKFY